MGTTRTFSGASGSNRSSVGWDVSQRRLTVTLGAASGAGTTGVPNGTPAFTPPGGATPITDPAGNALPAATFTAAATSRF